MGDLDVVIVSQMQTSSLLKSHSAHTTPVPTSREEFIRDNIITEQSASLVDLKIGVNAAANHSSTGTLTAQPTGRNVWAVCIPQCIRNKALVGMV